MDDVVSKDAHEVRLLEYEFWYTVVCLRQLSAAVSRIPPCTPSCRDSRTEGWFALTHFGAFLNNAKPIPATRMCDNASTHFLEGGE